MVNGPNCPLCGFNQTTTNCRSQTFANHISIICNTMDKNVDIERNVYEKYNNNKDWHILAGLISNKLPNNSVVNLDDAAGLMLSRPSLEEQIDAILLYIEEHSSDPLRRTLLGIPPYPLYCADSTSLKQRCLTITENGLIKCQNGTDSSGRFSIAIDLGGVKRLSEISKTKKTGRVFIAMQFRDNPYKNVIRIAVKKGCIEHKLIAMTVDEKEYCGEITDRIISDIKQSEYVVADYTFGNRGVYYESGYARGRDIHVIETCNEDWYSSEKRADRDPLHFDVRSRNIIFWKDEQHLAEKIAARIGSLI